MNILHVINYYHEGFGYQENFLAYNQKKLKHNVLIVTSDYYFPVPHYDQIMRPRLGDKKRGSGRYNENGVEIIRKKSYLYHLGPSGVLYFDLKKEIIDFLPDVIHVHGATNLFLFQIIKLQKKYHYKIFIDSHQDFIVEGYKSNIYYYLYYSIWKFLYHREGGYLNNISRFLPISRSAEEWLNVRLGVVHGKTSVSPLGVDLKSMHYSKEFDIVFREKYQIGNKIIIVNAGKQYEKKNILWIIDVAKASIDLGVQIFLVLVGNADRNYNEKILQSLSFIDSKVVLRLPFLDRKELMKVYCAADIGIWPGVPSNTIQEAMSCRVGMILPNNNIVGHLIDGNGINESMNTLKAAKFIKHLYDNKSELNDIKNKSQIIAKSLSWKNISVDLCEMYRDFP